MCEPHAAVAIKMETAEVKKLRLAVTDKLDRHLQKLTFHIDDMDDKIMIIRRAYLRAQREVEMVTTRMDLDPEYTNAVKRRLPVFEARTRAYRDAISISVTAGRDALEDSSRLELEQLERNYNEAFEIYKEGEKKRAANPIFDILRNERASQWGLLTRTYEQYYKYARKLGLQSPCDVHTMLGIVFYPYYTPSKLELCIRDHQRGIADKPNYG